MRRTFGVVDLFAGPGGLGEGFASMTRNGHNPFRIGISVEKEASAHRTLSLRAFLREYKARYNALPDEFVRFHAGRIPEPDWASVDREAWKIASNEARALELGTQPAAAVLDASIRKLRSQHDDTILIGGPPCQAYSLVGRARARGKADYVPEEDERHYLFREYIRVLDKLRPAVFVMENVKGMLSSTVESRLVFDMLMEDLSSLGRGRGHPYELHAIQVENGKASLREAVQPNDYIVRAEAFGIPQRRHRVIIVGIRSDLARKASAVSIEMPGLSRTVAGVLGSLPALRSGLSRGEDSSATWEREILGAAMRLMKLRTNQSDGAFRRTLASVVEEFGHGSLERSSTRLPRDYGASNDELLRWIERPQLRALAQHETRGHMTSDLARYLFAATFGKAYGFSPKAENFPAALRPEHRNWNSGVFNDRFRVQLENQASTTITSHISKDGHYFIHHDPRQCRSLTVREAARLQTFPDDYLFLGNRTQQYVQVGNAVPPFLGMKMAEILYAFLA